MTWRLAAVNGLCSRWSGAAFRGPDFAAPYRATEGDGGGVRVRHGCEFTGRVAERDWRLWKAIEAGRKRRPAAPRRFF
ncbi:hypothetical protein BN2476_240247 [Paraburkholderia piptadeniae]|uniref:Uncharacterized protein n=1 Tax=Paraburkholderia piptadeniae TaxID=1701573 RepID=A0A1N7RZU8_9BURK|nr:hypothetical protein BN2476_240247 [Paraburkholderia piptadeniae]